MKEISKVDKNYLIKDIEEFSELIKEITKMLLDEGNMENLIEEFADVSTGMAHIKKIFNIKNFDIFLIQKRKGVYKKYD
jgi:hypothetical protein